MFFVFALTDTSNEALERDAERLEVPLPKRLQSKVDLGSGRAGSGGAGPCNAQLLLSAGPYRPRPTVKSDSFFLPLFSSATNQRGRLPRPAQVSFGLSGLRYLGDTGRLFAVPFLAFFFEPFAFIVRDSESNRFSDASSRRRSSPIRASIAASTFALIASNSSKFMELICFDTATRFIVTPSNSYTFPLLALPSSVA